MTSEQRAMQLWSVLALAARNQQILSYVMVEDIIGVPRYALAPILRLVAQHCKKNQWPPLTAIVVNEPTGLPGELYPEDQGTGGIDVLTAQARAFVFNWLAHPPKEEDFHQ